MRTLATLTLLLASPFAWAERPIQLPGSDIEQTLPRPNVPGGELRPTAPKVSAPAPSARQPGQILQQRIQLKRIEIAGGGHYPLNTWRPLLEPLTQRPIQVSELVAAAKAITQRYQNDGFFISFAYVPNQDFRGGGARIVLVEGHIREVRGNGDLGAHQARVDRWIARLKSERPLTRASFERFSVLMNRVPGLQLAMALKPPTTNDGGAVLELAGQSKRFNTGMNLDSRRGEQRGLFNAQVMSLLGWGEQLQFNYLYPPGDDEEHYRAWNYSQLLGDNGLQLQAGYSKYNSRPDDNLRLADGLEFARKRQNERISAGLGIPVLLRRDLTWDVNVRGYTVNDTSRYDLVYPNIPYRVEQKSKLRVVGVDTVVQQFASKRVRAGSLAVYQGLNGMGAETEKPIRKDFTRVLGYGAQQDQFGERWQGVVSAGFQWTDDVLPDSEQVTYGGNNFGRGYPDDQASGDKGWGAAYEVNYSFLRQSAVLNQIQPYLVVDTARTHYTQDGLPNAQLGSAAVGIRLSNRKHYLVSMEVAKPFGDRALDNNQRSPRLNFAFSYQIP
ncbi:POTRA domain-containing protein, ShlB-type [Pseudomonas sp. ATCC 13867]|uniref:ShlB/FhaC/HecB family hemolysin secretion/activation protein n=1 Tax=Pseudomonas sp. ATCC 13867 TaxID=1294143 RepID=UPI0002C4E7C5|nr:ShlB/FhaC/HecB family hemolysin secretion/activation protein [Pseudomonas sp. ATCC 13867]AGI25000.1 POTRA domain-containing protein, ShlB-type [Pseudomonas sp. ATCC 13867]RFQ28032.1 ShlB/FhaC/HecB family hemolysin secretion/activation protein [Pseudomonas sp. ATCC 13867]